jgi:hypothetical protein
MEKCIEPPIPKRIFADLNNRWLVPTDTAWAHHIYVGAESGINQWRAPTPHLEERMLKKDGRWLVSGWADNTRTAPDL